MDNNYHRELIYEWAVAIRIRTFSELILNEALRVERLFLTRVLGNCNMISYDFLGRNGKMSIIFCEENLKYSIYHTR
jgi:hypothetical protein